MSFYTDAFTHRSFYAQKLLHREVFIQTGFYTHKLLRREKSLHRGAFTHGSVYTEKSFYTTEILHINKNAFYTGELLHTREFSHRSCHTQMLLRKEVFTQRALTHTRVYR